MIDEDWRGFSSAFAESVRPDHPRGGPGRRMVLVAVSTLLAVGLGALVYGALGGPAIALPNEVVPIVPTSPSAPYQAGGVAHGQTWTAIAGPSCAVSADGSTGFAVYGYYTGTSAATGWTTSASGGYTGDHCGGGYISVPVSGKAAAYNATQFALWTYDFSTKFTQASCKVSTYVPTNSSRMYVGGDPAYFYSYGSDYALGTHTATPLGGYQVNQVAKQGRWVTAGAFDVTTGKVTIKMVDAGADSGSKHAHVAAAQVRLTCTST
ncbi:hypothetical protein [Streptomyces sp. NPDC048527]|uniref:hypothetical protein n=1 Tax=Streptomyces sp. NPDC048527 TaxID=3365568 RepID=UPI0037117BC1